MIPPVHPQLSAMWTRGHLWAGAVFMSVAEDATLALTWDVSLWSSFQKQRFVKFFLSALVLQAHD